MRHVVNFGLLFSFVTLAVTGVLSFVLPFDLPTTRIHIVFGLVTLILVGLHLYSRVPYFKQQLGSKSGASVSRAWCFLLRSSGLCFLRGRSKTGPRCP